MDKRSILFIGCVSIAFLILNFYFSSQRDTEHRQRMEQERTKRAHQKEQLVAEAAKPPAPVSQELTNQKVAEQFYVLENGYQQLVFSNYGGALAEINLSLESATNKESVVKEIGFDRTMEANYPFNAHFPEHSYYTPGRSSEGPFVEHLEPTLGGYYPLLRRDLFESTTKPPRRIAPSYYAMNIVSQYPELAELVYEVKLFEKNQIVFEAVQPHRRITKTFSIEGQDQGTPYCINLSIRIEGDSRGLWLTSGVPDVEWMSGAPSPILQYRMTRNNKMSVEKIDLPKEGETLAFNTVSPDWVCNSNGFFGVILDPLAKEESGYKVQGIAGTAVPSRLLDIDQQHQRFTAKALPGYNLLLPLKSNGGTMNFRIFAGPFAEATLKTIDNTLTQTQGSNPDYLACQSFHGWFSFISEPFAKLLFIIMKFFYELTSSWAFSIVLLTVVLRLLLYPLNAWSMKSMRRMQKIAPEVSAIQAKHKKDPKKAQMEIMQLYRTKKVNPFMGCFPILIQMPFLIGMFDLLKSTFELRGAGFIPGWIDNLTAPDVVFSWNYPIFFIGSEFHLLPILLGAVMYFQQAFSSTLPKNKSLWTDQQKQQKLMGNIMTIVFAVMFYHFPSGLNLYWLSSLLLGILQQWLTNRSVDKSPEIVEDKVEVIVPKKPKKTVR